MAIFIRNNIYKTDDAVLVLDMECYGFEPRITDFARTANWFYKKRTPTEKADLLRRFQQQAQLTVTEIEILPLMMCAHDLYYAVLHLFLFLVQDDDLAEQQRLIGAIQWEMRAAERFERERDTILRAYRQGY